LWTKGFKEHASVDKNKAFGNNCHTTPSSYFLENNITITWAITVYISLASLKSSALQFVLSVKEEDID